MFHNLGRSGVGDLLCDYLERLLDDLCDVRNMAEPTPDGLKELQRLAGRIKKDVVNKVRFENGSKQNKNLK